MKLWDDPRIQRVRSNPESGHRGGYGPGRRRVEVRGRDVHFWTPPAQIRTSPIRASGSYLGCVTAKRRSDACRTRSSAWVTRARP